MVKDTKAYLNFEDRKVYQIEKQRRIIVKQMRGGKKGIQGMQQDFRSKWMAYKVRVDQ